MVLLAKFVALQSDEEQTQPGVQPGDDHRFRCCGAPHAMHALQQTWYCRASVNLSDHDSSASFQRSAPNCSIGEGFALFVHSRFPYRLAMASFSLIFSCLVSIAAAKEAGMAVTVAQTDHCHCTGAGDR